uniref:Uncharacterized protein n=2 Tax=Zea mays TaxID=4577 RepID=A0A804RB85_MAIZE
MGRSTLTNITNENNKVRSDDEERKRDERNRKQREYYARRKVDETTEERDARNKMMRDYRARKKAETAPGGDNTHVARAETPYTTRFLLQTPCSTISQASGLQYMDSTGPSDPMEYTMGTRRQTALTNISNQIITGPSDEHERHREERNRKQREYRARRKAEETNEEREARNKRMCDYRAMKKADTDRHRLMLLDLRS